MTEIDSSLQKEAKTANLEIALNKTKRNIIDQWKGID